MSDRWPEPGKLLACWREHDAIGERAADASVFEAAPEGGGGRASIGA